MDYEWLKEQLIAHPEKKKADLARAAGISPSMLSKILRGDRQIKLKEYDAMCRFFGLPGAKAADSAVPAGAAEEYYTVKPFEGGLHDDGAPPAHSSWIMPAELFEHRTKAAPEQLRTFPVSGDAMVPDFKAGEQVLVDLSDTTPSPPGPFVVSDGLGHMIRQCEYVPQSDPPQVRLSAHNSRYEPHTLPLDKAGIVGRVIARLVWL